MKDPDKSSDAAAVEAIKSRNITLIIITLVMAGLAAMLIDAREEEMAGKIMSHFGAAALAWTSRSKLG